MEQGHRQESEDQKTATVEEQVEHREADLVVIHVVETVDVERIRKTVACLTKNRSEDWKANTTTENCKRCPLNPNNDGDCLDCNTTEKY